jgi:tRNA dimethylallyltransferase
MELTRKFDGIIICGPTASGKSSIGIDYARKFNGNIINADRLQMYQDLPVLSATPDDLFSPPHSLYKILKHNENLNAKLFIELANKEIEKINRENKTPIIVGGTGMYLDCLINGICDIPCIPESIIKKLDEKSTFDIYNDLVKLDPENSKKIDANHRSRIIRALSVKIYTEKSIFDYHKHSELNNRRFLKILVNKSKPRLIRDISIRTNKMIKMGAIEEVRNFFYNHPEYIDRKNIENNSNSSEMILNTIGLFEILDYIRNKISIEEMKFQIIQKTCQYAKRQNTWFRNKFNYDFLIYN